MSFDAYATFEHLIYHMSCLEVERSLQQSLSSIREVRMLINCVTWEVWGERKASFCPYVTAQVQKCVVLYCHTKLGCVICQFYIMIL